jgi:large subunit ribosomal protein L18
MPQLNRKVVRQKVHRRIRKKISGTAERPRLAVHFSNQHVYAQLIDDERGATITSASTKDKEVGKSGANQASAQAVGELIARRAKDAKVDRAVFDRGGFIFHGKVKALADAAREAGLTI